MLQELEVARYGHPARPVFEPATAEDLINFSERSEPLALYPRKKPEGSDTFFASLLPLLINVSGKVHKARAVRDIEDIVSPALGRVVLKSDFYRTWLRDMANVCQQFAALLDNDMVGFSLSSQRGCKRYHQDKVPMRLLVTYAGSGTEWLPPHAANLAAYENGGKNEQILKDPAGIEWINPWDVAVFKGAPHGLLHRTPDTALPGKSLLMRLDSADFWDHTRARRKT